MPGLEEDHEFLYSRGVSNDFPRLSLVWGGTSPPPHPIHDLYPWPDPTSAGQFGEILWDNSSNASDIIEVLLFLEIFLRMSCSSHMGTFDGKPGNKKNWEDFFPKLFLGYLL